MASRLKLLTFAALALAVLPAAGQEPPVPPAPSSPPTTFHSLMRYQGRGGPEQTEHFSRRLKIGRDARVTVSNLSGLIAVKGGSGDELSIDAVKRTHGDQAQLSSVQIVVEEHAGRVDVRTDYDRMSRRNVEVDYTITVPTSASLELKSVSGDVRVAGVRGAVRAEAVSGNVTIADTPRVELAKAVSGDVDLGSVSTDGDVTAASVSGNVRAKAVKARSLDLSTVSGDVVLNDAACERLTFRSVSGDLEYTGTLAKNGQYDINLHSGDARLTLTNNTGFELNARTFSGSIRADVPGAKTDDSAADDRRGRRGPTMNRAVRVTYGDATAALTIHTFSGDIIVTRR